MNPSRAQVNPETLPPGTVVGGCWRVVERLGAGGFGAVYKVEATNDPGRYFALKLALRPEEPRTRRELTLLMDRAVHSHVVAVHACGRWPDIVTGHFYFVMDYVPGPPLHLWADQDNPSFRQFVDAACRVALLMDTLHASGVLHRDLKPEHILMRAPHGDPVLIDLGSGDYDGAPTLTTGPLPPGTLHLRSPEAIRFHQRHRRIDVRYTYAPTDDLYALGVCFYRALTGHYPFPTEWPPDVLCAAIVSQQPPEPWVVNPRVPPALGAAILRLLDKDPAQRIQTGAQLHGALTATLDEHPRETWDALVFDWHEPPQAAREGAPARTPRTRRPGWPSHTHKPPSVVRAKLLRMWARLLGILNPPPEPTPHASPGKAVVDGWARRVPPRSRLRPLLVALGLCLVALTAQSTGTAGDTTPEVTSVASTANGQKLASLEEPPHTATAASPPLAGPTSAAATPSVASPQEAAAVKKTDAPEKTPRARIANTLARTAAATAMCANLACASAPQRVEQALPPAEECPPATIETMENQLDLIDTDYVLAKLVKKDKDKPATVSEGRVVAYTLGRTGLVGSGHEVYGELYIGRKRVHGRFTKLLMNGKQYPVCLEIWEENARLLGTPRKPGGDERNAIINPIVSLRAVDRFAAAAE